MALGRDKHTKEVEVEVDSSKSLLANKCVNTSHEEIMQEDTTGVSCVNDQISEATTSLEHCKSEGTASVCPILSPADEGCIRDGDRQGILQKTAESLSIVLREETTQEKAAVLQESKSTECKVIGEDSSACLSLHTDEDTSDVAIRDSCHNFSSKSSHDVPCDLSIVPCHVPLQSPSGVDNNTIRSPRISPSISMLQNDPLENLKPSLQDVNHCSSGIKRSKRKSSLAPTEHLAASLHHGIKIIDNHLQKSRVGCSLFRFSCRPVDFKPLLPVAKVDIGIQTISSNLEIQDPPSFICSYCKNGTPLLDKKHQMDHKELQLVPADGSQSVDASKIQLPKAVEKVLAGAIRREMASEDHCTKQNAEIAQLKCLIQQYKHERECNAIIEQIREDKISRLESLMDGILPTEEFMGEEYMSLLNEHKLLKDKYDNHPEVLRTNIELKRVQEELEKYNNFFDLGEKEILMEELQDLRSQLQYYIDNSPMPPPRRPSLLKLTYPSQPTPAPIVEIPELTKECAHENFEEERQRWTEAESKWISLSEELRLELEASRSVAEKLRMELGAEKKCSEELKEALQTAMKGHAHILDQYADLQEKHFLVLARHQQIRNGIEDIKQAAAKAGVKGAESKFINSLAAQVSALKADKEKERRYWKDENKGLQTQLRDTAEALQAAGELLLRLKEAEEATAIAQKRTIAAEKKAEKAYQEIDTLQKKHQREIDRMKQELAESRLPKGNQKPGYVDVDMVKYDDGISFTDQKWKGEFEPSYHDNAFSEGAEQSSWFSGYDQCNI